MGNELQRYDTESQYEYIKRLVRGKLVNSSLSHISYEELSKCIFGKKYNADVARRMCYGIKYLIDVIESSSYNNNPAVANRILTISDLHIPFNLPTDIYKKYIGRVDTLVFNGDIEDCQSISKYPKQYRIDFVDEMITTRTVVMEIIDMIKPKTVIFVKGNHEARMGKYLSDNLNEDIFSLMPDSPMDLIVNDGFKKKDRINKTETWFSPLVEVYKNQKISIIYNGDWWHKIGKTIFTHPLAYSSGMLKTTEKAVNYFLRKDRDFSAIVMAHTHKVGTYVQGNIQMFEQGCCCDLTKLSYTDGKLVLPPQNGYLYLCHDVNGDIIKSLTEVSHW